MSETQPDPAQPTFQSPRYMEERRRFFGRPMPEGYAEEWAHILEQPMPQVARREDSMLVFRIADLPLALSSRWIKAVTPPLTVCPLPHRANTAFLGLVAYGGDIIPCCSVARILGAADSTGGPSSRTVVLEQRPGDRWAFPVDAVFGISPGTVHRKAAEDSADEAAGQLSKDWSEWLFEDDHGSKIDILRPETLFQRMQRAIA